MVTKREHFRGVVWLREPMNGPVGKIYRYPIVGMIVSDHPIEAFEGKNEIVLDGSVPGISESFALTTQKKPSYPLGTADNVLCSLELIVK